MVKPDYTRDYYADLELTSTADALEVKKQFKKLALKYHPDRNPGKEDEAKDKFLVIQAAHEILTDPALKIKYDANRKRTSAYPSSSGVKGNPYQNVSQDMKDRFGAPPRRKPATPYSGWAPPQPPKPKQADPADHLRAWDRMRSSSHRTASYTSTSGTTASKPARPPPKADPPPPPPRTAYQARQQEASFGAKRTGFAPASPFAQDEPQVKNHHYTNIHTNVFEETAANLKKPKPASAYADPLSEQFSETFLDNRQRTPYSSHVGEKTNPFEGSTATREKSVREGWRKAQESDDDATPPRPQRQRSASVGESDGFKKSTNENTPFNGFGAAPNLKFTSQASARYSPRPVDPTSAPPTATAFGTPSASSTTASSGTNATANRGAPQKNGPKVYAPSSPECSFFNYYAHFPYSTLPRSKILDLNGDDAGVKGKAKGNARGRIPNFSPPTEDRRPFLHPDVKPYSGIYQKRAASGVVPPTHSSDFSSKKRRFNDEAPPSGENMPSAGPSYLERCISAQLHQLLGQQKTSPGKPATYAPTAEMPQVNIQADTSNYNSFTVPDDDDDDVQPSPAAQQARFMRNSTDNINTRFVAEEKAGESFQFNAGGPPTDDPFLRAKQRSRSAPRGRQSPPKTGSGPTLPVDSFANIPQPNETTPKPSGFDTSQWTEKIGPQNFMPPPVTRVSASPTRHNRTFKKPKPVRMTAGTAGLVDDEETSGEDKPQPTPAPPNVPSPNAMDIDPPSVNPMAQTASGARSVHVEPSKPEWRAGDVDGTKPDQKLGSGLSAPKPSVNAAVGSEDTEEFLRPVFPEFQKTEPFAPKSTGLGGWGDMKFNLPFPSQPSAKLPLEKEKEKPKENPIDFPPIPICPPAPAALAIKDLKPSVASWDEYQRKFTDYLKKWIEFEHRITSHFNARKNIREKAGDSLFDWVNVRSDKGLQQYQQDLEADDFVRQKWTVAAKEHKLRVREFAKHRDKMKQQ